MESKSLEPVEISIVVASGNPVKHEASRRGLQLAFPEASLSLDGISVPSGVSDQPMSDGETLRGALQRAEGAARARPDVDFWVGLEGGVEALGTDLFAFAWAVVRGKDGRRGRARTASFQLPAEVAALVRDGVELGEADDRVFRRHGSKRQGGAVGLLTEGRLSRADLYVPAVLLAAVPFLRPRLYSIDD
ncbi:MAG: inosine/xanthosine triphosphatase [Acidobacteriota bacterium]